ncbi:MAG: POTRA domain-containing protein [Spirochaetia bacterium]|nr:POTRA domain-containing protein [Spirochaetia bacterium]
MSKNNLKKLFCFSTLISLCSGIFGAPIAKFTFEGLKKTDESYMQNTLERFLKTEDTPENLHAIETALQAEGIFEKILIQPEQIPETGETQINITLKEKSPLYPFPLQQFPTENLWAGLWS